MSFDETLQKMEGSIRRHDDATIYSIEAGDTLSKILTEHYQISTNDPQYKVAEAYALYFNHHIENPDYIYHGDNIRLMPIPKPSSTAYCPVPDDFHHQFKLAKTTHRLEPLRSDRSAHLRDFLPYNPEERELFFALARADDKYHWLGGSAMGFAAFEKIAGVGNRALASEVGDLYQQYKNGQLTRGQYDYQRAKNLKQLSKNLGGLQRFLFEGQTVNEAISINRKKGIPATQRIAGNVSELHDFSKLASRAGVVLTGIGAGIACDNIGNAESREEKNEIFVEFVGGTGASLAAGAVLGIIFATTPVGWGAALIIGGASVAAGWAGSSLGKVVYDNGFKEHDLVANVGLDKYC